MQQCKRRFDVRTLAPQTWGVVAAVGASAAAYYLAVLLGLVYYALALPLPSSFYKTEVGSAIGETFSSPPFYRLQRSGCAEALQAHP